ncbi:TetR/AcrR family transcriptional regulator [Nocardia sp. NEAU-351]|uniref:TetR/AcrR family transcriptional regulator n=2 Tax=Nocardia bovistercoris TaxID=2785916 RepID=A0A931IL23_9NOCA|nr:TetR/AcrR family transcriptional regulator [Nocardia bovistercoris]MBH0781585.1 TetR/AcrR family transcriptional regulator [Nocardia bovistercoris]
MYAALTRTAILDAARKLFVENGFDATSVDDIARESQLSKGAVYHHFHDKQQVFAEVYRAAATEVISVVAAAAVAPDLEPWERAEVAARTALSRYAAEPDTRSLLRQVTGVLGEERTRAVDSEIALPLIRGLLEELKRLELLRPVDVETTAQMVFRLLAEASLAIALAADPDAASREVEIVMLSMLRGLRADASP